MEKVLFRETDLIKGHFICKACVRYFRMLLQKKALKELWKMLFISPKKLFVIELFKFLYFALLHFYHLSTIDEFIGKTD